MGVSLDTTAHDDMIDTDADNEHDTDTDTIEHNASFSHDILNMVNALLII